MHHEHARGACKRSMQGEHVRGACKGSRPTGAGNNRSRQQEQATGAGTGSRHGAGNNRSREQEQATGAGNRSRQHEQATGAGTGDLPTQMLDTGPQVVVRIFVDVDQSNEIIRQPVGVSNPDSVRVNNMGWV